MLSSTIHLSKMVISKKPKIKYKCLLFKLLLKSI